VPDNQARLPVFLSTEKAMGMRDFERRLPPMCLPLEGLDYHALVTEGAYELSTRRLTMTEIWDKLDGYKTYIVMWTFVGMVMVEKGLGYDLPGFEAGPDWMEQVLAAFGLGAVRSGMKKMEA
jgi:hypothetical protein